MNCDILILTSFQTSMFESSTKIIPTIKIMMNHFEQMGLKCLVRYDLKHNISSKCIINYINLTVTPQQYVEHFNRFSSGINTQLVDIGKRIVCESTLLQEDDDYVGSVIVKTNLNYGGLPELRASKKKGIKNEKDLERIEYLDPNNYPIYRTPNDVPKQIWRNPNLVIQKCAIEKDEEQRFCLRSWYLLGNKGFHVMTVANHPIVKGRNILDRWVIDVATPPELTQAKTKLGMDFGRMDYVLVDGKAILFDINRTPTSSQAAVKMYERQWQEMSLGIEEFLSL